MKKNLNNSGISDLALSQIIDLAKKFNINKLYLFGSRARGDHRKTSDIDLALSGGNIAEFSISVFEDVETLLTFDIVNLDGAVQQELLTSIKNEGVLIYEKI